MRPAKVLSLLLCLNGCEALTTPHISDGEAAALSTSGAAALKPRSAADAGGAKAEILRSFEEKMKAKKEKAAETVSKLKEKEAKRIADTAKKEEAKRKAEAAKKAEQERHAAEQRNSLASREKVRKAEAAKAEAEKRAKAAKEMWERARAEQKERAEAEAVKAAARKREAETKAMIAKENAEAKQAKKKKKESEPSNLPPGMWTDPKHKARGVVPSFTPTNSEGPSAKSAGGSPGPTCQYKTFGSTDYLEGVQILNRYTPPKPFQDFKHGSDNKEGLFVLPGHELAMCIIEKNGCTSWLTIFNKLTHNIKITSPWYGLVPYHWSPESAQEVFNNSKSTRIVWVRDPLERFLSGFLDKCAVFHDFNYHHICSFHWDRMQKPGFPLAQVEEWFTAGHQLNEVDSHFTPQAWHCELRDRLQEYNLIGLMSKANFARDAACMLKSANLEYLNIQGGRNGQPFFAVPQNEGDMESKNTEILKKFFTKEFANHLIDLYKEDYDLFRIKRPTWVNEATGEWFNLRTSADGATMSMASDLFRWNPEMHGDENAQVKTSSKGSDSQGYGEVDDLVTLAARAGFRLP